MMKNLLILTHEDNYLMTSLKSTNANNSVCLKPIVTGLNDTGWNVEVCKYSDIDKLRGYTNFYILYASSEDYGQFYKDYIEDILLWLVKRNNTLIPDFNYFRAHHNKVYMELLKESFQNEQLQTIKTYYFSNCLELKSYLEKNAILYPVVVKASAGAGSGGVALANNEQELMKIAKKLSARIYFDYYANLWRTPLFQNTKNMYRRLRNKHLVVYRKKAGKYILQSYVAGLKGDYKILIFGNQYFMLQRLNREGDFRASGSGKFSFPDLNEETEVVLNFAQTARNEMNQPMLSLDIAYDGSQCHLIEFQAVHFGPYTLENSEYFFECIENKWVKRKRNITLEEAVVLALNSYINT